MSEVTVEQNGSTVDIIGSTGSTVDISETNTISDGNDSIEIISTGQAFTVEIQSTSTVLHAESNTSVIEIQTGYQGETGETGTAATIAAGTTTTGTPGTDATVTNVGTSSAAVFNFVIPRGNPGVNGNDGADGVGLPVSANDNDTVFFNSSTGQWEAEPLIIGKPTDAYAISNTEDAGTYKYFGFEDKDGNWYIMRKTVATNIFLYVKGASAYSTAWTNRASQSYASYESTF